MLTGALRAADLRRVAVIALISLLAGSAVAQAAPPKKKKGAAVAAHPSRAQAPVQIREWGPYLDVACELTYWDPAEIREWREKREQEIGETLAEYITAWSGKLAGPAAAGAGREDNRQPLYRDRDYLRLAIAQTVDYLQSENRDSLEGAAQLLDMLKEKGSMPEVAYWTGFVQALQALENYDAPQFVSRVYDIWNNAVIYLEQGAMAGAGADRAGAGGAPFHYRNIVNLVVNRAIIDRKLADLNALGPLFLMLRDRDLGESAREGQYLTTLVQRIAEGFAAPDSDRYRLNFTVAVIEAKRLQQIAAAKLDSQGMTPEARTLFEQSRLYNDYALKWAASPRSSGAVAALADYLDITSFAIQRLADNEKAAAYQYFAMLPTHDGSATLLKAMAVFNEMAAYGDGGWEKAGYASRELYLRASHRLWRAIMELALWTGDFYLMQLNATVEPQSILTLVAPLQAVLSSYLDFLASRDSGKFPDAIPDSACFGAAEAAEKLAYAYQRAYAYSTDSNSYNLWFLHRLQAAELFPLDPREIAQTGTILRRDGRYNLFLDYFLPLAERFKRSAAVKKWLDEQKSGAAPAIRDYVNAIDGIFAEAPGGSEAARKVSPSFAAASRQLREELQRKPDHPVHKLLKAFYLEEMAQTTPYTLLLKDASRLNRGM